MARPRDPYLVLGVSRGADDCQVKRAYRQLVLALHPDVSQDPAAAEKLRDVQWAYDMLGDPDSRRQYESDPETSADDPAGSPSDLRHARAFVRSAPEPLGYADWRHGVRFNPEPFATADARRFTGSVRTMFSMLDEMLGGFVPEVLPRAPSTAKDLMVEVTLSADEALTGTSLTLAVPLQSACDGCSGSGIGDTLVSRCELCSGRGFQTTSRRIELVVPSGVRDGDEAVVPLSLGGSMRCSLRVFVRVV